jgi:hypothetical protein
VGFPIVKEGSAWGSAVSHESSGSEDAGARRWHPLAAPHHGMSLSAEIS